jgi:hypothetical protein
MTPSIEIGDHSASGAGKVSGVVNVGATRRRPRLIILVVIAMLSLAAIGSVSNSTHTGSSSTPAGQLVSPAGQRTDQVTTDSGGTSTNGSSFSGSEQGGVSQNEWPDICAGGGCNPNDGLPTVTNGGGLALPDGGN